MTKTRECPALLVSAPASGQGKTSVTAALARWHTKQGRRVRVFKTGPDFLDPMVLEQASGTPAYQLDLWMCGEADVRQRLFDAAGACDLILVEGVMGLFDGDPSSADLAQQFGLPVMTVIDGLRDGTDLRCPRLRYGVLSQEALDVRRGSQSYRAVIITRSC